jgi:hypothetical protein
MTTIRIVFLSLFFTLFSPFSSLANNFSNTLQSWQTTYLSTMSAEELQFTANFLYLSYAIALIESKIQKFPIPLSTLNQSIRKNIVEYKNTNDELVMLKTLIDRLSYITGARLIYTETLNICMQYYNQNSSPTINAALESIQLDAQERLSAWADSITEETAQQLKKTSDNVAANAQYLHALAGLYKGMSEGEFPLEIPAENEQHKSLIALNIIISNNNDLLTATENINNALTETYEHATQVIATGAEIYKHYYMTVYNMLAAPTFEKRYSTTLFGMHDILPNEYKTALPDAQHVFEHMLQTTKLYTQTELLHHQ